MNIILFDSLSESIPVSDRRAVHILKVLRLKEGDSFSCGVVRGSCYKARIDKITPSDIFLSYSDEKEDGFSYPLTLIIGEVRPICMRRILREVTSLGAKRIILTLTEKGEKSYHEASLYKSGEYKEILLDGAMQAGCTYIPQVIFASSVKEAVKHAESDEKILLDNIIGSVRLSDMTLEGKSVTIAIGSERGFSDNERNAFLSSGFTAALIGNRILRTETACVAATALALERMNIL